MDPSRFPRLFGRISARTKSFGHKPRSGKLADQDFPVDCRIPSGRWRHVSLDEPEGIRGPAGPDLQATFRRSRAARKAHMHLPVRVRRQSLFVKEESRHAGIEERSVFGFGRVPGFARTRAFFENEFLRAPA